MPFCETRRPVFYSREKAPFVSAFYTTMSLERVLLKIVFTSPIRRRTATDRGRRLESKTPSIHPREKAPFVSTFYTTMSLERVLLRLTGAYRPISIPGGSVPYGGYIRGVVLTRSSMPLATEPDHPHPARRGGWDID